MKTTKGHKYKKIDEEHVTKREDVGVQGSDVQNKWQYLWRMINVIMMVFFGLAGYVNLNDPDPYLWVPVYLLPALLCLFVIISPSVSEATIWRYICVIHLALCIAGALYLVAIVIELLAEDIHNPLIHEEGRELGGLLIIIVWLFLSRFTSLGSNTSNVGTNKALLLITLVLGCFPIFLWALCFIDGLQHLGHCTDMFPGMLGTHKVE